MSTVSKRFRLTVSRPLNSALTRVERTHVRGIPAEVCTMLTEAVSSPSALSAMEFIARRAFQVSTRESPASEHGLTPTPIKPFSVIRFKLVLELDNHVNHESKNKTEFHQVLFVLSMA